MSNEHTHDTHEPTGARLTDELIERIATDAKSYHGRQFVNESRTYVLSGYVLELLADRAARVAEVARLQASLHSSHQMIGEIADELTRVEDQNLAMRPLVERIARGDSHEFYVSIFGDTCCIGCNATASTHIDFPHDDDCTVLAARALVATLATEQTPAAPRLTGRERIQALRDAQATPPTGEITAIMVSRDSELTEPPVAPDTPGQSANRQRYPHFGLVWTVIDAVAAGDNERARAYADLLADHLDADNYPYEAKRIRNRLSPDYDPGPLLYLMAETPAAPTPDGQKGGD